MCEGEEKIESSRNGPSLTATAFIIRYDWILSNRVRSGTQGSLGDLCSSRHSHRTIRGVQHVFWTTWPMASPRTCLCCHTMPKSQGRTDIAYSTSFPRYGLRICAWAVRLGLLEHPREQTLNLLTSKASHAPSFTSTSKPQCRAQTFGGYRQATLRWTSITSWVFAAAGRGVQSFLQEALPCFCILQDNSSYPESWAHEHEHGLHQALNLACGTIFCAGWHATVLVVDVIWLSESLVLSHPSLISARPLCCSTSRTAWCFRRASENQFLSGQACLHMVFLSNSRNLPQSCATHTHRKGRTAPLVACGWHAAVLVRDVIRLVGGYLVPKASVGTK